jgi:hypothetical protein
LNVSAVLEVLAMLDVQAMLGVLAMLDVLAMLGVLAVVDVPALLAALFFDALSVLGLFHCKFHIVPVAALGSPVNSFSK